MGKYRDICDFAMVVTGDKAEPVNDSLPKKRQNMLQNAAFCHHLNQPKYYKSLIINQLLVLREGFEPSRPCGHHDLNVACLPFHHLSKFEVERKV